MAQPKPGRGVRLGGRAAHSAAAAIVRARMEEREQDAADEAQRLGALGRAGPAPRHGSVTTASEPATEERA